MRNRNIYANESHQELDRLDLYRVDDERVCHNSLSGRAPADCRGSILVLDMRVVGPSVGAGFYSCG